MTYTFAAAIRRAAKAARRLNARSATKMFPKLTSRNILLSLMTTPRPKVAAARTQSETPPSAKPAARSAKPGAAGKVGPPVQDAAPKKTVSRLRVPQEFRRPLGEVFSLLRGAAALGSANRLPGMAGNVHGKAPVLPLPAGAEFQKRSFTCKAGARDYKLYVPASAPERPKGLIVMLHGCTQNPDDFAAGTNINALAETHGLLIAYPAQTRGENASSCWNWFEPGHQRRDRGEPAILAGLARSLVKEFGLDRRQVFVAGLSAGAAMAVILGKTYPDVFSAIGVHSGLAYQSAGNVMSAMAAMQGSGGSKGHGPSRTFETPAKPVRAIIFHGSADRTVHPRNAEHILSDGFGDTGQVSQTTRKGSSRGRHFTQTVVAAQNGTLLIESWLIDGTGHAWSGGSAAGSFTDSEGPDASFEFVRFFLSAPR